MVTGGPWSSVPDRGDFPSCLPLAFVRSSPCPPSFLLGSRDLSCTAFPLPIHFTLASVSFLRYIVGKPEPARCCRPAKCSPTEHDGVEPGFLTLSHVAPRGPQNPPFSCLSFFLLVTNAERLGAPWRVIKAGPSLGTMFQRELRTAAYKQEGRKWNSPRQRLCFDLISYKRCC